MELATRINQSSKGDLMPLISVACAMTLTEWSESTFRRRFADGTLKKTMERGGAGRAMVEWSAIRASLACPWPEAGIPLLLEADAGHAVSQREVGLELLIAGRPRGARQWLLQAAKREDSEAAYWLSRLHLVGDGAEPDVAGAMRWLGEAARLGHAIARAQIAALSGAS